MAFALALQSVHDLPDGHGQTILTATISIVVLSVLLIGGSTSTMLEALHVVGDSGDNHRPLEEQHNFDGNDSGDLGLNDEEGSTTASRFKLKLRDIQRSTPSFTALDKNYLTPFFTSQNGDTDDEAQDPMDEAPRISRALRDVESNV
ncbi:hypothetical protein QOZ80_8AG0636140 [Eleusine coracana subsp. coracana]|nr:hypothetical protein QOZ80_8AG0636140 [Eleusine coracana subsp. coracana]